MDNKEAALELDLIRLANVYANKVIFWNDRHRRVIKKFLEIILLLQKSKRKTRHFARKPQRKKKKGSIAFLFREPTLLTDSNKQCWRLSQNTFNELLQLVGTELKKCDTNVRNAISPELQLGVTLRFLTTGESYISLKRRTKISHAYLVYCIPRVCKIIWKNLKDLHLKLPQKTEQWELIAEEFENKWQFPLCLGALDAKHINSNPNKSIILLTLTDANCKFLHVDVCASGKTNVGEVLKNSALQSVLDNGEINFPKDKIIGNNRLLPYVMISDNAFALQKHLIKPFPQQTNIIDRRIYNERILRAMQVAQRTFSIISARFHVLQKPINIRNVSNIELIIKACCVLHNFLMDNTSKYADVENISGTNSAQHNNEQSSQIEIYEHDKVRKKYMNYFSEEGKLEFMVDTDEYSN